MSAPDLISGGAEAEFEQRGPTIRDRRRIDPETYEVREPRQLRLLPSGAADDDQPRSRS